MPDNQLNYDQFSPIDQWAASQVSLIGTEREFGATERRLRHGWRLSLAMPLFLGHAGNSRLESAADGFRNQPTCGCNLSRHV
jgi:hypothetical protein